MTTPVFPPIPEGEFELYADLYAKEGRADDLERYLRALVRLTKSEPGVLEYAIARDDENPNHFHVFERYTGRKAFEEHIAAQEFVDFTNSGALAQPPKPKMLHALKPL
ncbi:hypothetical protein AYL99_08412 [Fonsecaea erecta]|uniref:ABM domain-containing protein n=1 Tax=Fonsecaea erecta TaxID=1367422 RepID=A0A178ZCZ6_9EURO|nr:hypothetical protein AYL99_08412 [Fonsecaea erecta]OAP57674.1 hypothetical protein AYL99_08412 [Fonsecaea erecta]